MSVLEITNLAAEVVPTDDTISPIQILHGVNLTIRSGETHALMGPNGSGKSTLTQVISGHPKYRITAGTIMLDGVDITEMTVDERARAGLFASMQHPIEIPGVSTASFLRTSATALRGEAPRLRQWIKEVKEAMDSLDIPSSFTERSVNEGFSGGEKKRCEILQLDLFKPKFALLDEIDSGLDIDALRVVSSGINSYQEETNGGILLITHYQRILRYVIPDKVHVFVDGRIIKSGGPELANELEQFGYDQFLTGDHA